MTAEKYNPGVPSAAMVEHNARLIERTKIYFDNSPRSQEQLQIAIEPKMLMTVIREKMSIGLELSLNEKMVVVSLYKDRSELPLVG